MEQKTAFVLNYLPMRITLIAVKRASLPEFLGSTLRGVIGQELYPDREAYNYLYHNRIFSDNKQDIPNPYMIIPPDQEKPYYEAGEKLVFQILLFGDAIRYTQAVVNALKRSQYLTLGASRYPFKVEKVVQDIDNRIIWENGNYSAIAVRSLVVPYCSLLDVHVVNINLCTPLRIRRGDALLEEIDFETLIRNITHRVSVLTERYGGWVDIEKMKYLQENSAEIILKRSCLANKKIERYSNRIGGKMDFSGLLGSVQYEGELTPFVPWLHAAEILHIGRNTTFGMGKIMVEYM